MTLILFSISQDSIPLLGFETRFSFELILCNQLLVSKVVYLHCYKPEPARQETSFLQGASKVAYMLEYNGKNIRLKVSYKWFLKPGFHIVGKVASMCLRPCPKKYITALQVSVAKISCERLLL